MVFGNSVKDLAAYLRKLDGRSYGGYKEIRGDWVSEDVDVCIDRVQGDPFAAPSIVRLRIHDAGYSKRDLTEGPLRTATCDLVLRRFAKAVRRFESRGSGKSGQVYVNSGGAEILARSGCEVSGDGAIEIRCRVGLPAQGRRIRGNDAAILLAHSLPTAASEIRASTVPKIMLQQWQKSAVEHAHLAEQCSERGLVTFVADGSVLPRQTGVSSEPMRGAIKFESPESLRVELSDMDGQPISGMGIPSGITIITGPGFHGKSTLLRALQTGVYPHIPGDGRERVVTDLSAVKVRSEDGRAVTGVNLRPFIKGPLPGGKSTVKFFTEDASGSTSLAASIQESLEAGAKTLLLDEDTCATNLLVRDARMQELVKVDAITPLVDRVRQMNTDLDVSVVAVIGGCGDYLDVADTTLAMREYRAFDVTKEAKELVLSMPSLRSQASKLDSWTRPERIVIPGSLASQARQSGGKSRGLRDLIYGNEEISLDGLEQLVDESQVKFVGILLEMMATSGAAESVRTLAEKAIAETKTRGIYGINPMPELASVRAVDLIAVLNRLRKLRLR